jgi:hypothetical protein
MPGEYVEQRNRGYYIQGTRVSLDSVVYAFLRGESADGIAESFPAPTPAGFPTLMLPMPAR